MDLVFGKFVTTFTGFATGSTTPAQYRSEVNKYTLYFLYLFIAKFGLVYIHSVSLCVQDHVVGYCSHSTGQYIHRSHKDHQSTAHRLRQTYPATRYRVL